MTSKTSLFFIGACIYFLVAAGGLGFAVYTVHNAGSELQSRVALINDRNAKIKMYTDLSRLIEQTKGERTELSRFVLDEQHTSLFLTEVESLARTLGVQLSTEALTVVPKDGNFDDLSIEFSVEGSNSAVRQVLLMLETLPYHSTVASVLISKESTGNVHGTIKIILSLRTYDE